MGNTVITKIIDIQSGKAITNVKELKKEIASLKDYLASLDKTSVEYTKTIERLNQYETQLNNINKISQQNTQKLANQLSSLSQIGSGLAGGFSALQGVFALLGKSGDDLEKTFVKLQSGIAIVQGIGGLEGLANNLPKIKDWFDRLKDGVVGLFDSLNPFNSRLTESAQALNNLNIQPFKELADIGDINISATASGGSKEITQVNQALQQQQRTIVPVNDQWNKYDEQLNAAKEQLNKYNEQLNATKESIKGWNEKFDKYIKIFKEYNKYANESVVDIDSLEKQMRAFANTSKGGAELSKTLKNLVLNEDALKKAIDDVNSADQDRFNKALQNDKVKSEQLKKAAENLVKSFDADAIKKAAENFKTARIDGVVDSFKNLETQIQKDNDVIKELQNQIQKEADVIKDLENQLQSTTKSSSKFAGVLKSVFATVGWTVAITAIVTLIYKLYDYIKTLSKAKQAQKEFNEAIDKTTADIASGSIAAFNELLIVYDQFSDKTEFLKEHSKQIEETGLKINNVKDAEEAFVNNTDNYKKAIIARAQIDAYRQKVAEKTKEYIEKQLEIEREGEEDLQEAYRNVAQYATGTNPEIVRITNQAKVNKQLQENEKEYTDFIDDIFNKTEELRKEWKPFWKDDEDKEGSETKVVADKDLELIKSFIKASEELLRSDKENALILLDEKYSGMLELAEKYGLDSNAIQEAYDKERYEITKKYNKLSIEDTEATNKKNWDDFQKELARIRQLNDTSNLRQPQEQTYNTRYGQKFSRVFGAGFDRNEVFTYQSKEDIQNQYADQIKYNNDLYALTKQRIDQENELLLDQLKNEQLTADQKFEIQRTLKENEIALSDAAIKNELDNAKAYDNVQAKKRQALQATLSVASSVAGSIASIAQTESQNEKLSEEQRKKAFTTYKIAATTQAIMDTYAAANSSYQSMASIPYVGPFLGAAAAAAAIAAGIANVVQIQRTQFSASSSVSASSVNPPNITQPNIEYTRNLLGDKEIDEVNKPIKVYVTERDITEAQTKVKVVTNNATF